MKGKMMKKKRLKHKLHVQKNEKVKLKPSGKAIEKEDVMLDMDSDTDLQLAFEKGLLKPGLNVIGESTEKTFVNKPKELEKKLKEYRMNLSWHERLDMTNKPAPLNPEMALEEQEHEEKRMRRLKQSNPEASIEDDNVHNDFKRELMFYRQGQAALMEGLPKLHQLGMKTERPQDYFAQMAKSDDHMQKIRQVMMAKKAIQERSDKVRKIRELKKYAKQIQVEAEQQKHKEKRQLLDKIKKYQKGLVDSLDFLDESDKKNSGKKGNVPMAGARKKKSMQWRRQEKDKKYGFGGQKKRSKYNTSESSAMIPSRGKGKKAKPRLGKSKRQQMKNRKR